MQAHVRNQLSSIRAVIRNDFENLKQHAANTGTLALDHAMSDMWKDVEFFKPFKNLDKEFVLKLGLSFFESLPIDVRGDIIWFWLKNPAAVSYLNSSSTQFFGFLKHDHPRTVEMLQHFTSWLQTPEIKYEIKKQIDLPVWEVARSYAEMLKENLSHSDLETEPVLLKKGTRRNMFGWQRGVYEIFLSPSLGSANSVFSLADYEAKDPEAAKFLKKKLAEIVLHNALGSGLRSVISDQVKIVQGNGSEDVKVYLVSLGNRDAHPMLESETFFKSVSNLPLKQLASSFGEKDLALVYQRLADGDKRELGRFLESPQNLRFAMQMYQLQKLVGDDILKSEIKNYVWHHPKLIYNFLRKKWSPGNTNFNSQINRCQLVYQ
jgi:hypothetical protein